MSKEISVIGAGVVDVLVGAVDEKIFLSHSTPVDFITLSFGGDALNEAIVLTRLGKRVQWISKVGDDDAGRRILNYAEENGLGVDSVTVEAGLASGVNIVMINAQGERLFLTNPRGSLRKLEEADILPHIENLAPIVSFASMFVSPPLTIEVMTRLFRKIKASGRTIALDTTRAKDGETLDDLAELLSYVDYFFPERKRSGVAHRQARHPREHCGVA